MSTVSIACPKCRVSLDPAVYPPGNYHECSNCAAGLQIETFPALYRPVTPGQTGETILTEGEAGCFYHPNKKAVIPCEACGRFLCALCDIDLNGEHYCPSCVETGRRKGKFAKLESQRFLYDELALTLAAAGLVVCGLSAPVALFYAIWHWKSPISIVARNRWRAVAAIILSVLQIGFWSVVIVARIFRGINHVGTAY